MATKKSQKPERLNVNLGVRPTTRKKFEAIKRAKRWTMVETADALADEFLARENISVPELETSHANA